MFPFLLKGFPGFCGRAKSLELICISSACQNNRLCILITSLKFDFVSVKASGDRQPLPFVQKVPEFDAAETCVQTHYVVLKCNVKLGH